MCCLDESMFSLLLLSKDKQELVLLKHPTRIKKRVHSGCYEADSSKTFVHTSHSF